MPHGKSINFFCVNFVVALLNIILVFEKKHMKPIYHNNTTHIFYHIYTHQDNINKLLILLVLTLNSNVLQCYSCSIYVRNGNWLNQV